MVCICETLREEVIRRGVSPQAVFVVPNAVDPVEFRAPASDRVGGVGAKGRSTFTLGYIGSLRRLEGVDDLVRAVALLASRGCDVRLLVVGEGPELDALRGLADALGISGRTSFTGQVPHDQVRKYYGEIDAFIVSLKNKLN